MTLSQTEKTMVAYESKLSSDGRITIPARVLGSFGLKTGVKVLVEHEGDVIVVRRWQSFAERTAGILSKYRLERPLTPQEEREPFGHAVADEVAAEMKRNS
jgi:bifunctional DNA-binding transcriptional regulator/antitoxin component of YhaV-PrlF toxin-antitoxin module